MQMAFDSSLEFAIDSPASAIAVQLKAVGLNMFALLDPCKIDDSAIPNDVTSIMLIGNYGRHLWDCMPDNWRQNDDPVDDFTSSAVTRVLTSELGNGGWTILFPNRALACAPVLQQLGHAAGWHHPSPLGNGIHPEHGLWFAYRAVAAITADIASGTTVRQTSDAGISDSPCIRCVDQPCIKSCPPSALGAGRSPDLEACVNFRSRDQSPCAERCLARQQCPVGVQSIYADEQIRYFYRVSLQSLQSWVAESSHRE